MDQFIIKGGQVLRGDIQVSGSKNGALPILCASLLSKKPIQLENVPNLSDTFFLKDLLSSLGSQISVRDNSWEINNQNITSLEAPYEIVRKMRASTLVLGPLLARFGEAKVNLPGGCAIGNRPIDIHLKGLEALGANIHLDQGYIHAKCSKLKGAEYTLPFPSVGATQNLLMAACLAEGKTQFKNVAKEPEIEDLANFLRSMGAIISGDGSSTIEVTGVTTLKETKHSIIGDRIEAITFLCSIIATKGTGSVNGISGDAYQAAYNKLLEMGVQLEKTSTGVRVLHVPEKLQPINVSTMPHPNFPTDAQAQFMTLMTQADGYSKISENIFENRFMHVSELIRMGANIKLNGNEANIFGPKALQGAPVMATDLRASAALVIAALIAQGQTNISRIYHLDRGYENFEHKLSSLGADIERTRA